MNFLAHIYLSKGFNEVMLGNFMADDIKGKKYMEYPPDIIKGILLHRFIDDFTDKHPIVSDTKIRLRPYFGKYSPVVSDIIYDHFLALHFEKYAHEPLEDYVQKVYSFFLDNKGVFNTHLQEMLPYMIRQNWLVNYQYRDGLQNVFTQFSKRIGVGDMLVSAPEVLFNNYKEFEHDFFAFFPLLEAAAEQKLYELTNEG